MPSEASVFIVADAMIVRGERPSLRTVLEGLATGGSPREVCKHLRAWRKERGYDPRLAPTDVTEEIEGADVGHEPGPFGAGEFWDRVMREIFDILPATGTMALDEFLPALRSVTFRGAALPKEALTPSILRKKMEVRIAHGRYFVRSEDGGYARRVG